MRRIAMTGRSLHLYYVTSGCLDPCVSVQQQHRLWFGPDTGRGEIRKDVVDHAYDSYMAMTCVWTDDVVLRQQRRLWRVAHHQLSGDSHDR